MSTEQITHPREGFFERLLRRSPRLQEEVLAAEQAQQAEVWMKRQRLELELMAARDLERTDPEFLAAKAENEKHVAALAVWQSTSYGAHNPSLTQACQLSFARMNHCRMKHIATVQRLEAELASLEGESNA
jgi:hypothetical protein